MRKDKRRGEAKERFSELVRRYLAALQEAELMFHSEKNQVFNEFYSKLPRVETIAEACVIRDLPILEAEPQLDVADFLQDKTTRDRLSMDFWIASKKISDVFGDYAEDLSSYLEKRVDLAFMVTQFKEKSCHAYGPDVATAFHGHGARRALFVQASSLVLGYRGLIGLLVEAESEALFEESTS